MRDEKKGRGLSVQEDKSGTFTFGVPTDEQREKLEEIIKTEKSKRKKIREEKETS
jgi:hypothetical protein